MPGNSFGELFRVTTAGVSHGPGYLCIVDGCPPGYFLRRIVVPLSRPGIAVVALLAFLRAWNDLLWPLVATSTDNMRTVQVGLLAFSQNVSTDYTLLMAAAVMVVLPTAGAFLLAQRQIIEGIGTTGLRG